MDLKFILHERRGVILFSVLILLFIATFTVGNILGYASQSIYLSRRILDTQRAFVVAEAGLEYGVMRTRDILQQYTLSKSISDDTLNFLFMSMPSPVSPDPRYEYVTPKGKEAFKVEIASNRIATDSIPEGASAGLDGTYQLFLITCGALNRETGWGTVVQQQLQAVSTFVVRYGVFYEDDLEVQPGATMKFTGKVHTNGDVYVGGSLWFQKGITAVGGFKNWRKNSRDRNGTGVYVDSKDGKKIGTYDPTLQRYLDSEMLDSNSRWTDWMVMSSLRWDGSIKTGVHGVSKLSPPIDAGDSPHDIIERALSPGDSGYSLITEELKFVNKASLLIHVASDGSITAKDRNGHLVELGAAAELVPDRNNPKIKKKDSGSSGTGDYTLANEGVYQTENTFYDWREKKYMRPVDIYLDKLLEQFSGDILYGGSTSDSSDGIVYITRDPLPDLVITVTNKNPVTYYYTDYRGRRRVGTSNAVTVVTETIPDNSQPCVRIRNGSKLLDDSTTGLSLVSDLPVYVEGCFNTGGTSSGETHTAALIAGDAVTMLSKNWQDANSETIVDSGYRDAVDTKVNGVVMTGNNTTVVGGNYNGGLENVFRFMEDWGGRTFSFNGSIICMWTAEKATGPWVNTLLDTSKAPSDPNYRNVYQAPIRAWGYDDLYQAQSPPGIPRFFSVEETHWNRATWDAF